MASRSALVAAAAVLLGAAWFAWRGGERSVPALREEMRPGRGRHDSRERVRLALRPLPPSVRSGAEEKPGGVGISEAPLASSGVGRAAGRRPRKPAGKSRRLPSEAGAMIPRSNEAGPEVEPGEESRLAPIVRFGTSGLPAQEFPWLEEDVAEDVLVALMRLRDSGALRRLSPAELPRVAELMPESRGVRDADRILRERLGMSVGEFLARVLSSTGARQSGSKAP